MVKHVEALIAHGKGDIGRLAYILEKIKHNKTLYSTDQKYLEKMLKAYPVQERDETSILRETYRTSLINQELKTELKFAYEEMEKLEDQLNQLKKEKTLLQTSGQILLDNTIERQALEAEQVPSTSTSLDAMVVDSKLSELDIMRYAEQSIALRAKSGFLKKENIQETPLAWEKFLYPFYDVEMEITAIELEKTKTKYDSITKTIRCRAAIDGRTGVIADITKEGISYKYSFLNDLSADEISLLYYVNPIQNFTLNDLDGLGLGIEKSMHATEKLAGKGYLKQIRDKAAKYETAKQIDLPNPSKLKSIVEEHGMSEVSTNERRIKPSITAASLPLHLGKYWNKCHVPASMLVYYPFYGITYDRKDYYRIEVIDGVTGKRQSYLEHIVTVRPQNKIEHTETKVESIQKQEPAQPKVKKPKRSWKFSKPKFNKPKSSG